MAVATGSRAFAADIQAIIAASSGKYLVRLVQQTAQTLSSNVDTAITFGAGSEEIETTNWHDVGTNTSRITPTAPGYIRLRGTVWYAADTDDIAVHAAIGKNGTIVERNEIVLPSTATASTTRSVSVTCFQQCNGSTDYVELFGRQLQATAGTLLTNIGTGGFSSTFECEYLRPL